MQNFLHSVGEILTPPLKDSNFIETGRITPEQFVLTGDFLVYKCSTWSWSGGDPNKTRSILPPNKQILVTKNVPISNSREEEGNELEEAVTIEGDEWIRTKEQSFLFSNKEAISMDSDNEADDLKKGYEMKRDENDTNSNIDDRENSNENEDIPDIEDFDDENNLIVQDPFALKKNDNLNSISLSESIQVTRTYDLYISYDKYYQTPRLWLVGYDEEGKPLPSSALFTDISKEHAKKTVTLEQNPHFDSTILMVSIHPCQHAHVMKRIIKYIMENENNGNDRGGNKKVVQAEWYLILFLKFMSTVLPNIDYDYTMTLEL